jgi:hypothetical protein
MDERQSTDERSQTPRQRPLQFGLRTLLGATAATALLFGVLRWLDVPPRANWIVLLVALAGALAALALVAVIAGCGPGEDDRD